MTMPLLRYDLLRIICAAALLDWMEDGGEGISTSYSSVRTVRSMNNDTVAVIVRVLS